MTHWFDNDTCKEYSYIQSIAYIYFVQFKVFSLAYLLTMFFSIQSKNKMINSYFQSNVLHVVVVKERNVTKND